MGILTDDMKRVVREQRMDPRVVAANDDGEVVVLAGGTGVWTEQLDGTASSLTVIDAAPEMLAINRARVGSDQVRYVAADLFTWQPERTYDAVFFSHVDSNTKPEAL